MTRAIFSKQVADEYAETIQYIQNSEKVNPNNVASDILDRENIITFEDSQEIFSWNKQTGLYEPFENQLKSLIQLLCDTKTKNHLVNEIVESIRRRTYKDRQEVAANLKEIPLENGIYDFWEKKFRTYSPNDLFLFKHPIKYCEPIGEQIADTPIDSFIEEITADQTDAVLLKEIVGYCFYRAMPFQNFFLLVGSGANGKSVFLNIVRKMLGEENVSGQSIQAIGDDKFALKDLYGKNANIFGDLPKKALKDTGTLKQLTGDDHITARVMFSQKPIKFYSYAKILASCNEAPEIDDPTDAIYRRVEQVIFPKCFYGKENRNLAIELCTPENFSSFFITCTDAFRRALEAGNFIRTETVAQKREKYMNYSNSSAAFCELCLEYDPESEIEQDEVWKEYQAFCQKKAIPMRPENYFFRGVYKFFDDKVYRKRRREENYDTGEDRRHFVLVGAAWRKGVQNAV